MVADQQGNNLGRKGTAAAFFKRRECCTQFLQVNHKMHDLF